MNCEQIKNELKKYCTYEPDKRTKNSVCYSYHGSFLYVTEKWLWTDVSRIQIMYDYVKDIRCSDNGLEIEIEINKERFVEVIKGCRYDI